MKDNLQAEEKQFAEEVGIVFEQTGIPRMAGRILGWLLISDPPHQSTEQLTKALLASKG
ncbi:MAG: MarR family transcriptional regulator, partial [Dehalococcoidia bacterium]